MRTFVVAALVASSGALLAPPANAACIGPVGCGGFAYDGRDKCSFVSFDDPVEEGMQNGFLWAGPLVTAEDGTLVCEIHVNNNTHDGSHAVAESADANGGVVVMEPRRIRYPATAQDSVSMCTTWHGASGTLYWRGGNTSTGDLGNWSTAPTGCGEAIRFS